MDLGGIMAEFEQGKLDAKIRASKPDLTVPDFTEWTRTHGQALDVLERQAGQGIEQTRPLWQWVRVAAVWLGVVSLGFVCGRLSMGSRVDPDQLRSDLQTSLHTSFETALTAQSDALKSEMITMLRRDLAVLTSQTLETSRAMTDQRVTELIRLIENVRQQDRQHIVAALDQIEQERLRDKIQIQEGFKTLVAYATENNKTVDLNE